MSNDNNSDIWSKLEAHGPDAAPIDLIQEARRLNHMRLARGVTTPEPHRMKIDIDREPGTPIPWIRTKKNGAIVSRLGVTLWDIVLLALLTVALGFVAAGYQFHFWDWVCQNDGCQFLTSVLNARGRQ